MGAFLFSQSPDNGDLTCTYSFGTNWLFPEHNGTSTKLKRFEQNATIEYGDSIHTKEQSLCELKNKELHIRLGSNSILEVKDGELLITKGNILINNKSGSELSITSELSTLKTEGQFTAIIDCTSNGGFKFIPLEGKGKIIPEHGKTKDIYRGRLTMIIGSPSQLGSAYDIDLLLLLKSSRLINSFPTPLPSLKRISLSVYAQQLRMKGKYNALIGDAPTNDNLQMWAFGEDDAKK
jgi:hypothetical protein